MIKHFKLHSSYNPQKEAERFSDSIKGCPKIIILTEPGESYLAPVLRKKFPETKLIAMRYTDTFFLDSDKLWDSVWRPASGDAAFFLINHIPDEYLPSTIFLPWKAAENIWPQSADAVWKDIAKAVKIIQSVIATRSFFGKKWLKNMGDNLIFTKKPVSIVNLEGNFHSDIHLSFFAAAGPSLDMVLNNCDRSLNKIFTLAAASALPAFKARNIKPDLCISTDGGFWAGNHLKYLAEDTFDETVLAFPMEAKIPYNILKNKSCVFLSYGSALESFFFEKLNIKPILVQRNGSVSGTAAEFLLDKTKGNIFLAGLDLKESKGFSHCIPHESQNLKNNTSSRLDPLSNFAAISNFDLRSLKTYKQWFRQLPNNKTARLFRLGKDLEPIGNIKSKTDDEFNLEVIKQEKQILKIKKLETKTLKEKKAILSDMYKNIQNEIKTNIFFNKINTSAKQKNIEKELCEFISFQTYISFLKEKDSDNPKEIRMQLEKEMQIFLQKQIQRLEI